MALPLRCAPARPRASRRDRRRLDRTRRLSRRAGRFAYERARVLPGAAATGIVEAGFRRAPGSSRSIWSVLSHRSAGSVLSSGSFLSVASAGSAMSAGSILSVGSAGSILSIGSAGSILSVGAAGGFLQVGSGRQSADDGDGATRTSATVHRLSSVLALAALAAAATSRAPGASG